jgi:hypothetical protein
MPRWGMIVAGAVVFALVASQVLLPGLGAHRVEKRLTKGGGTAEVTLGAVPALRLLFGDGERLEVTGSDLVLDPDAEDDVFERLDGFSIVDISIADASVGPVALESFELRREGDGPYHLVSSASASASAFADAGLGTVELPGESVIDMILGELLGADDKPIPIELDMQVASEDGRLRVVSGGGEVAGLPTGPLAELLSSAIVVRI